MSFEAKYHSTCTLCRETIRPGDVCSYDNDQLIHDACLGASEVKDYRIVNPRQAKVCPTCNLTKPCECD